MQEESASLVVPSPQASIDAVRSLSASARHVNEIRDVPGLLEFWRVLQKRRATILTVLFVVFTVTLVATLKEKPVYRARALVEIQKENPDIPSLQELFQVENISDSYLETQYRILRSESLARSVIAQTHVDRSADFASEVPDASLSGSRVSTAAQPLIVTGAMRNAGWVHDKILRKFQDRLDIEPLKRSRLIEISFESTDRQLAAQVVNTLTSDYIEQNLQSRWDASQNATEWLSRQLLDAQAKVEKSQDALQKYARENGLLFLDNDKGTAENIVAQRLRELQDALTKAQAERFEKESVYHLLQDGDYASVPEVLQNKLMQDLTVKIAELERDRSKLATIFNPDYPRLKQIQNQIDDLQVVLSAERSRAAQGITNAWRAAVEREQMLRQAFKQQQAEANVVAEKSVQYNILKREADTNERLYIGLLEKMKETGVSASLKAPNVRVVDAAFPPIKPDHPKIIFNLVMGLLLGLCLGTGTAFLQEHLDNTLKTPEDSERFLQLPTLAFVPTVRIAQNHGPMQLLYERARVLTKKTNGSSLASPPICPWTRGDANGHTPALTEAFHGLRTSVLFSIAKRPPVALLVTSTQSGEGKTTIAANLAVSLGQLGEPVLLIDADLRRPSVHNFFGLTNSPGLVNYLAGHSDWRSLIRNAETPGLSVLVSGPAPPNPVNLLSSEFMRNLLREATQEYKYVLLDSPPLANLADSRILSTLVDGLILVVAAGITPRDVIHRACATALDAGSQVLGVAMNYANASADRYGSYGYPSENSGERQ